MNSETHSHCFFVCDPGIKRSNTSNAWSDMYMKLHLLICFQIGTWHSLTHITLLHFIIWTPNMGFYNLYTTEENNYTICQLLVIDQFRKKWWVVQLCSWVRDGGSNNIIIIVKTDRSRYTRFLEHSTWHHSIWGIYIYRLWTFLSPRTIFTVLFLV